MEQDFQKRHDPSGRIRYPETPRKTIGKIRKDRIYRFFTIPLYFSSVLFMIIPCLLIFMELTGRLFQENKVLGILALISGALLCFIFIVRILTFRYRDLSFEKTFVVFFIFFLGIVSLGNFWFGQTLSIRNLVTRYHNSFNTFIQLYDEPLYEQDHRRPESYQYSKIDSIVINIKDHPSVEAFTTYASKKHYDDMLTQALYYEVCDIMSLYRVFLEDFDVLNDKEEEILDSDPQKIIEFMEAGHSEMTLFFAACLMNLDYLVRVRKNLQGRLVTEIRINTSMYFDLDNFLVHEDWIFTPLIWYLHEFLVDEPGGVTHIVPLYLPIHNYDYNTPSKKNSNMKLLMLNLN